MMEKMSLQKLFVHKEADMNITEHAKIEKNVKKEQQELNSIIDSSPNIIFYKDKEGKFIRVNKAFADALKVPKEEFQGKTVFDFYSNKIAQSMANDDSEVLRSGLPKLGIIEQYESAQGLRWVRTEKVPIFDATGTPIGLVGFAQDITEQKEAEEALRESEERLKAIVMHAPIGIAVSDVSAKFVSANDEFCRILGYTEDELKKLTFRELTHPEDIKESISQMEDLRTGKTTFFAIEKRYIKKDGSVVHGKIMVSTIRDQNSKPQLFIAELEDITERKKAEEALTMERDKLETVTQSIGAGLVIISEDYRILWANGFIKRYKGDVEGKICFSTLNELDEPCPDCGVKKIFEKGILSDAHEYKSTTVDGKPYWVEIIATPIRDKEGKIVAATEIAIDITERKNMQKRLLEFAYRLNGLSVGSSYLCESHEHAFKAYADLTFHGVPGVCIVREDPEKLIQKYGIKPKEIRLLASKPIKGFEALKDLQAISLAISEFLKQNDAGVLLLDGIEYLVSLFGFDPVYKLIQEKRFDFLENEALLLMPIEMATLSEREKALITSELKILK